MDGYHDRIATKIEQALPMIPIKNNISLVLGTVCISNPCLLLYLVLKSKYLIQTCQDSQHHFVVALADDIVYLVNVALCSLCLLLSVQFSSW